MATAVSILVAVVLHLYLEKPLVAFLNDRYGGRRRSAEFRAEHAKPAEVAP